MGTHKLHLFRGYNLYFGGLKPSSVMPGCGVQGLLEQSPLGDFFGHSNYTIGRAFPQHLDSCRQRFTWICSFVLFFGGVPSCSYKNSFCCLIFLGVFWSVSGRESGREETVPKAHVEFSILQGFEKKQNSILIGFCLPTDTPRYF